MMIRPLQLVSVLAVLLAGFVVTSPAFAQGDQQGWGNIPGRGTPTKSAPEIDPVGAGGAVAMLLGGVLLLVARRLSPVRAKIT